MRRGDWEEWVTAASFMMGPTRLCDKSHMGCDDCMRRGDWEEWVTAAIMNDGPYILMR
ncbi:hypothetical protein KTT_28200 [Tengunoibacter tsumagoiensis]|uniref:Uncharacterized protein n=1 Tax=Tengunoibacter tsumagoiensis TaxID=2014871 RepID=A0A402A1U0_9CHLR|nr:hypothetical protein KTT_28200 [Tengunoibacter tsumagoiensis]